jgi:hypothetical protein
VYTIGQFSSAVGVETCRCLIVMSASRHVVLEETLAAAERGMRHFDFISELTKDGNVTRIAEHGLTTDGVEPIVRNPDRLRVGRSTGRITALGGTPDGRYVAVVYERIDACTVYPNIDFAVGEGPSIRGPRVIVAAW